MFLNIDEGNGHVDAIANDFVVVVLNGLPPFDLWDCPAGGETRLQ